MKRRGNNEGMIRKRTDGRWEARISLEDGKTKAFYAKTRAEVAERLATALHERKHRIPQVDEKQTVGQYLRTWCDTTKSQIRQSTYRRYGDYVRNHLIPGLGEHRLAKLTAQYLQLFYTCKIDEGLSPTTVHHMHGVLHRALEDALRMGLVQRNVADMVRAPRKSTREMRTLLPVEVRRFLDAVRGDRFEALYILALSTGMRGGELLGLRWQDIDFARQTLQVRMNVQETLGRYILAETKRRSTRAAVSASSALLSPHSSAIGSANKRYARKWAICMTRRSISSFPMASAPS